MPYILKIEDRGTYVCSEVKIFIPANYGRNGEGFLIDGITQDAERRANPRFTGFDSAAAGGGSGGNPAGKPGSGDGRVIRIINANERSLHERVLLNLRTTQAFEDVVADLGQVLKINHANKLYTRRGREIRGFSHLRNDFYDEDTFYVSQGPVKLSKFAQEDDDDISLGSRYSARSESRLMKIGSDPSLLTARYQKIRSPV